MHLTMNSVLSRCCWRVAEREIILNPHGPLTFAHVNPAISPKPHEVEEEHESTDNLDDVIAHHIQRILEKTKGKVHGPGGAAELLGSMYGRKSKL